jgi:hypothetical protein
MDIHSEHASIRETFDTAHGYSLRACEYSDNPAELRLHCRKRALMSQIMVVAYIKGACKRYGLALSTNHLS